MDKRVQKSLIPYDVERLKGSVKKHEENIESFEKAIDVERQHIKDEEKMIVELEIREKQL